MVTTFEEITADLTEVELRHADEVAALLVLLLRDARPIKQHALAGRLNHILREKHKEKPPLKITTERLRKYFNYFRSNGHLPIIATSNGCFISEKREVLEAQIKSLEERARQIQRAADGLRIYLL